MARGNIDDIRTFAEARSRLEEIVKLVKDKDMPLDKSLDLFEEAIELGNRCADLIDDTDFSAEELAQLSDAGEGELGLEPQDGGEPQEAGSADKV